MEQKLLNFWEKNKIFEKSVAQRKDRKKYVFFDGPPFANGLPHYGHILANALKDAVTRYWSMRGYYVPRTNGWDCHGLPVEYEIEKELKISGRQQIEKYGVEKFNEKCRESVFRYTNEWEKMLKRIARWVDFEDSYATLDTPYMESIWWAFNQIWKQKMVYQGHKSLHICPRCETTLSQTEVSEGYKNVKDPSVIVKFELADDPGVYLISWTTTPWTLPGNTALYLNKDFSYVKVKLKDQKGFYIVAKDRTDIFDEEFEIVEEVKLGDLVGKKYKPLFDYFVSLDEKYYQIDLADFVTLEQGTGIVHSAMMYGDVDFVRAQEQGLKTNHILNMDGRFKDEVTLTKGLFYKDADPVVLEDLKKRGLVYKTFEVEHSYPHCWRCETPLINYATSSWFIKVTAVKNKMMELSKKINWVPAHIKEGRFGKWLAGAKDWAISRDRFWGCPIPIWECEECGKQKCIGSINELKKLSINGKLPKRKGKIDLHVPYISEIKFKCACDGQMSRISEVLDCWFESGSMPYAQMHYPFENKKDLEDNYPADFIAEGLDQTRGWFYTLHVLATILSSLIIKKDAPAFKNVIVNGILLAADGEKLSKRKKNYPDPHDLFETYGVDSMRYFLYSSTAPLAEDVCFSEKHVDEVVKKFILTLWNTFSFFVTYARIDKYKPPQKRSSKPKSHKLDQWILSELNLLIKTVTAEMNDYNLTKATRPLADFVDNLSNWYVRRSRRRFWKSECDHDKKEAYDTLYEVLVTLAQLLAPFTPFLAEEIFRTLKNTPASVHLTNWPKANPKLIHPKLNKEMRLVRQIVNLGHAIRAKEKLRVRQPLAKVQIALPHNVNSKIVLDQKAVILEELNVKELEILKSAEKIVKQIAKPNARALGPKYGKEIPKIFALARQGKFKVQPSGNVKLGKYTLKTDEIQIGYEGKPGLTVESEEGIVVVLDTKITRTLKEEGIAREIVRFIQDMRKEANFNVSDRIYTMIGVPNDLQLSLKNFAPYIQKETLTLEFRTKGPWDLKKEVTIENHKITLAVKRG